MNPVQAAVSQIILDLKLRGYVSHDDDPNWTKEGRAWDAIVARFFPSPTPEEQHSPVEREGE